MDPRTREMLAFFSYSHLTEDLRPISKQFADLAEWVAENLADGPEKTTCLRKILEAKDCAVRTAV